MFSIIIKKVLYTKYVKLFVGLAKRFLTCNADLYYIASLKAFKNLRRIAMVYSIYT